MDLGSTPFCGDLGRQLCCFVGLMSVKPCLARNFRLTVG
jgi:hypothetical protein